MTKILYLADTLGVGGAERQLSLLVKYLPSGWERRVWSLNHGSFADEIRSSGISVDIHERRFRYDILPIIDLWRVMLRWRPDIVHSWGWVCSAATGPICRLLGIPWIDGSIRIGGAPVRHKMRAKLALLLANRVVTNSLAGLRAMNIPEKRGRVVYNGFDPERLALTEKAVDKSDIFTVVMVGRMSPFKDYETFIEVAKSLGKNGANAKWHFLALGYGPQREELIKSASDLIDQGLLDFPDAGLEVLPYVRQAQAGVLMTRPPNTEGCSNAIMEYMACGLPVICSESGGNRELVVDGVTGFIVPPMNISALEDKLLWLHAHPDQAQTMGMAGRKRFCNHFTVEKFIEKNLSVYQELLR